MQRHRNLDEIQNWFIRLALKIETNSVLRHLHEHIELENFFRDLLAKIYGWSLENANWSEVRNQDSFDLRDRGIGLAIQVTSTTDNRKVKDTLSAMALHRHSDVQRLVFVYPVLKKHPTSANFGDLPGGGGFDTARDRLDLTDLLEDIQNMPIDRQNEVVELLRKELKPLGGALPAPGLAESITPPLASPCVLGFVGFGFAGTVTAIRVLELATRPLRLTIIHSEEYSKHGGLAYGETSADWEHLLNIQAGRISIYRERPTDFLDWINTLTDPEKAEWPKEWKTTRFFASSAVPRRVYGQYLSNRFSRAKRSAKVSHTLEEITATVDDIIERSTSVEIRCRLADGSSVTHQCDRVLIATGHDAPLVPDFLLPVQNSENVIASPYSEAFPMAVTKLSETQSVLIVGTGLTSFDAVLTLSRCNFRGHIYMVSRHGFRHRPYPGDHLHDILPLPLPPLPREKLSAQEMGRQLEQQIERGRAILKATQPRISLDIIEERVLKGLEPWIAQWIQNSEATEVKQFLDAEKARITTMRTGIVPEVNRLIAKLEYQEGRLETLSGNVEQIRETYGGFEVTLASPNGKTISSSLIVCCTGSNTDVSRSTKPLWQALIKQGSVRAHEKTGRGIAVDHLGAVVRGDGSVSERLFAVGPMRQGDEIERRGRLGAFVFSIGTIRNQALLAAIQMLRLGENPSYAALDRFQRGQLDDLCDQIFLDSTIGSPAKRLVNAILAVRLADAATYLGPGHETATNAIENWLGKHVLSTLVSLSLPGTMDRSVVEHVVWYLAMLRAAQSATDIRRLADDYYRVRKYGAETKTVFLDERLACGPLLRAAVAVFGAATVSLLVFTPDRKTLYPFAMYRRVESFTPTKYGQGVAGALVKAFYDGRESVVLDGIEPCLEKGAIIGAFIPDYNDLHPDLKKQSYVGHQRRYPTVLLALLIEHNQVLGVIYIEAERGTVFGCEDAKLLAAMTSGKIDVISKARVYWDKRSTLSYRFGDFEGAGLEGIDLSSQDLSQATFRRAQMTRAILDRADLTGTVFDYADLSGARIKSARLIGSSLVRANLRESNLDGADINYCTFIECDLTKSHLAGATIANSTFSGCGLSYVTLEDLDISTLDFSGAVMRHCVLRHLRGADGARWDGVDLTGSRVDAAVWNRLPELVKRIHERSVVVEPARD